MDANALALVGGALLSAIVSGVVTTLLGSRAKGDEKIVLRLDELSKQMAVVQFQLATAGTVAQQLNELTLKVTRLEIRADVSDVPQLKPAKPVVT